jgi:hypothetical protein
VVLWRVDAAAMRDADDHRAGQAAAGAVPHARHMVGDLVQRRVQEAHELDLGHGLQSLRGHAHRHAGDQALGQRRVLHAQRPEALLQPDGGAEHAAVDAHVLAQHDHVRIVLERAREREVDAFDQRDAGHWNLQCAAPVP